MLYDIYNRLFTKIMKRRVYNNLVEAAFWARWLRKLFGASVMSIRITSDDVVKRQFSQLGLVCYLIWYSLYFYCSYIAICEDQTILRRLHKTKLQRFGDDYERCFSLIYVSFSMILTPFKLSGNHRVAQKLVNIDKIIAKAGYVINYNRIAVASCLLSSFQVLGAGIRILCIWHVLKDNIQMPPEKLFQVVFTDTQAIIVTSIYSFFLIIMKCKYRWVNEELRMIKENNMWANKIFIRKEPFLDVKKLNSDRDVCEKLNRCAKVYSELFETCSLINSCFAMSLLLTMFNYLNYVVLYLFYFMEATAVGLFHDIPLYLDFLVFTFWEITIALAVIFLIIYFAERTMKEAQRVAFELHEIINEDHSTQVKNEAMQFSMQLLHEKPVFTVFGLFDLNNELIQQGARSVSTYLVILLQFATDNK